MQSNSGFDLDDAELRRIGERVLDFVQQALASEQSGPVLRRVRGREIRERLDEPLPVAAGDIDAIFETWRDAIQPYARRNGHPRFFGYVCTSADPIGVFADTLASVLNNPVTAWRSSPSAAEIERLVVRWLDTLTGFGAGGSGILVSGGSMANFHGLACAIIDAEHRAGLEAGSRARLCAYLSREAHVSMRKALVLLGVPQRNVRILDVDAHRRMRAADVREAIRLDREAGLVPAVVCASAGTANTGTIDPLGEVADVCAAARVWYHIDGSYGAPAVLTAAYAWMADAFARADSLSLDPHKWLFAPPDAGCILIRDDEAARRAFMLHSEYTAVSETDPIERYAFFDRGLEMSRRFRGLKIWMILKARGTDAIRDVIAGNIATRAHLDARIASEPRLESLGSELSIGCFRYRPADAGMDVDSLNRAILERILEEAECYMSPTELDGRYALRACIVNFRTRPPDVDFLLDRVLSIGAELEAAAGSPSA